MTTNTAAVPTVPGPLPFAVKFMYGLGEAGEGIKLAALETFLFFYYVQVVGLPGTLTGTALLLALLFDGLVDPLVGLWSDRTRSRFGRRHPWLYAAPVPLAIALYFLFSPPALSHGFLFLWLTTFAIAARFAMTCYFVPHMALGAELSRDFNDRLAIGAYRTLFTFVGRFLTMAGAFGLFFKASQGFRDGQLNAAAYAPFALFCGILIIGFVILSALGTQRRALEIPAGPIVSADDVGGVWQTFRRALSSKSFRALFIALLIMYIFTGTQAALALHVSTFFWQLKPSQIQFVFYASSIGFIVGIPLARPLANRYDKKPVYMTGIMLSCLATSLPVGLRLIGLFPENGSPLLLPLIVASQFFYGLIGAVPLVLGSAMLADLTDDYEYRNRHRAEGFLFGINAFCRKASTGIGGALAGLIIDFVAFPKGAAPGTVPADILTHLGIIFSPVLFVVLLLGILTILPYDINRPRQAFIVDELAKRLRRQPTDDENDPLAVAARP